MGIIIALGALVVCLFGAYFIAALAFKKIWTAVNVSYKQLFAFAFMLVVSFIALFATVNELVLRHISFGR